MENSELINYLSRIRKKYNIIMTSNNYQNIILQELNPNLFLEAYFKQYMETNKDKFSLEWGCLLFLLMFVCSIGLSDN